MFNIYCIYKTNFENYCKFIKRDCYEYFNKSRQNNKIIIIYKENFKKEFCDFQTIYREYLKNPGNRHCLGKSLNML